MVSMAINFFHSILHNALNSECGTILRVGPGSGSGEFVEELVAEGVGDEGCSEGLAVAVDQFVIAPLEVLAEAGVFLFERHVGDGAGVGADAEGDAVAIELIDAMVCVGGGGAGLDVAAGADLEMDAMGAEVVNERGIFDAADAVADAGGLEVSQRLPHAAGTGGFTGVRGAVQAFFDGEAVGGDMGLDGESGFIAGDIECDDARTGELLNEPGGLEALRGVEVTKCAEDEAGFDAGGADGVLGGAIDGGDDSFGCESLIRVEERRETEFGVDDVVGAELLKDIFSDDAERVFSLHELESAGRAGEEVGEAGALRRSDEFSVVLLAGDVGRETRDSGVAEGAVEVEVEFDFGKQWHRAEFSSCDLSGADSNSAIPDYIPGAFDFPAPDCRPLVFWLDECIGRLER